MRRCTLVCSRDGRRLSASITAFLDEVKVACRSTRLPLELSTPYLLPTPDFVGSCRSTIASVSWPSDFFSPALGMKMADYINEMDRGSQRARSPALPTYRISQSCQGRPVLFPTTTPTSASRAHLRRQRRVPVQGLGGKTGASYPGRGRRLPRG